MQGSGLGPDYGWTRRSETTAKLRSATSDTQFLKEHDSALSL